MPRAKQAQKTSAEFRTSRCVDEVEQPGRGVVAQLGVGVNHHVVDCRTGTRNTQTQARNQA